MTPRGPTTFATTLRAFFAQGFNTHMQVRGPSGGFGFSVVAFGSGGVRTFTLPETGSYRIQVFSDDLHARGVPTTGSYWLSLRSIAPANPVDRQLTCGAPAVGSIASPAEVDQVTFTGTGSEVEFLLTDTGFGTFATVYTPSGTAVATFQAGIARRFVPANRQHVRYPDPDAGGRWHWFVYLECKLRP